MFFGLGETWQEIDLTDDERKQLEGLLSDYVDRGRKSARPTVAALKREWPETTPEEREAIRAWAKENGLETSEFGRIPKKVTAAYRKAHPKA